MPANGAYVVCIVGGRLGQLPEAPHHVGPFHQHDHACRYAERIEESSNGSIKAHVASMTTP